jgi:hypothetical protein
LSEPLALSYTSVLDNYARCPRYHKHANIQRLEPDRPALGMEFGSAGHVALGVLYDTGDLGKALEAAKKAWAPWEGMDVEKSGAPGIRTQAKLREIITAYYEQIFKDEKWEDMPGEAEKLTQIEIEVPGEHVLRRVLGYECEYIIYRLKIDRKGHSGGVLAIQEWKFLKPFFTSEFIVEPNAQIVGYLVASEANKAVVTVIDVMKSEKGMTVPRSKSVEPRSIFHRDPCFYEPHVFEEWKKDVLAWASMVYLCQKMDYWPKHDPGSCGAYGGCPYRTLCASDEEQRKVLSELSFKKKKRMEVK